MSDLTPAQVETRMIRSINDLTEAQSELAKHRDSLTEAEIVLEKARVTAAHDPDCPMPVRGGTTVAERDAWIRAKVMPEWEAWKRAETARDIAQDAIRTQYAVTSTVQSIARSVQQAYALAGSGR